VVYDPDRAGRGTGVILDRLEVDVDEFARHTGWALEPHGACKGAFCVPLGAEAAGGGRVDVRVLAERLGMPLVEDAEHGLWALGPETLSGRALTTAAAPELVLPDVDGRPFALSSLRGQKVVLSAWASW
jgi:hypothetical protein